MSDWKSLKNNAKEFSKKGLGPHPVLLWCSASFLQSPTLIHLDLDLWLSPVWGEYFDLLKNRVLGDEVPRGSWQAILAGCQPQRKFGVPLLLAPAVALQWGLEACAFFLKYWIKGGIGSQDGKSSSHWKLWCHSQISYCSQLGSPFDSWGLKQNLLWNQKKRNTLGWISGNALMVKSGKWQTCITREMVGVPKLESFQTMLETSLEKVEEKGPSLVESPRSLPTVRVAHFSEHVTRHDF